jgi:hypothetical protein
MTLDLTYVLPLRVRTAAHETGLTSYLKTIAGLCELIVVDASAPDVFAAHHRAWDTFCRHIRSAPDLRYQNGKVNGVITGVREARHDKVVIADEDVRYDEPGLRRVSGLLDRADLVRPQNYFSPLPWHARWDTARTLINRSFWADFPGTLAVRRSLLLDAGGYDGDVLFENLELMRTIDAAGGRVATPLDLYVRRLPPGAKHFWSQRVRQAYDDFALPARMAAFLSVLPLVGFLLARRRFPALAGLIAASVLLAERGRLRAGGAAIFPFTASLFAPLWAGERAVCVWLALFYRLVRGGCPYYGATIARAANSKRAIAHRIRAAESEAPVEVAP